MIYWSNDLRNEKIVIVVGMVPLRIFDVDFGSLNCSGRESLLFPEKDDLFLGRNCFDFFGMVDEIAVLKICR